jgi:crotonobetainyl-CoA:carnitine CoA-transferase CaiB-like acyl-CoA transferase
LLSLNGDPKGDPVRVTVPLVDVMTSELVVTGVLAALLVRTKSGQGQRIDVSLLDALVHAQASGLGAYFLKQEITPRTGNRSQYFAPSGVYPCSDGKGIVITCPSDKFFANLCRALEVDWTADPRFRVIAERLRHQDELDVVLAARCRDFPRDELLVRLIAADVLAAPIHDIPEVAADVQVRHNEMIVATKHATLGRLEVTGVPIKLRGTPGSVRLSPPVHGQHTVEILHELGFASDEVATLRRERTIGVAE